MVMKRKIKSTKHKTVPSSHEHVPKDLQELTHEELSGYENKESSLAASSTDENEDEGLGDGNMGRNNKNTSLEIALLSRLHAARRSTQQISVPATPIGDPIGNFDHQNLFFKIIIPTQTGHAMPSIK